MHTGRGLGTWSRASVSISITCSLYRHCLFLLMVLGNSPESCQRWVTVLGLESVSPKVQNKLQRRSVGLRNRAPGGHAATDHARVT